MKLREINSELQIYNEAFERFIDDYNLPSAFFERPDHFAIKCADEADYQDTCYALTPMASDDGIWQLLLDGRYLGSAELATEQRLGNFVFHWVEIMQPKPGKETERGFVEHMEFYFPDFSTGESILKQRGIEYEMQQNPGHNWINIVIDEAGREIKLNDKPLAEVVKKEREDGLLRRV